MTTRQEKTGAPPGGAQNVGSRRRTQTKDALMPDEPPKALGLAIPIVAALLIVLLVTLRLVEYQDGVPINLTLKASDSLGRAYGEAYLPQGQAATVRAEQIVDIDLGAYPGGGRRLQAKVGEITTFDTHSFYRVRVDLPPDFALGSLAGATPGAVQVQATILTQKENLLDKLFGAFRHLSRDV